MLKRPTHVRARAAIIRTLECKTSYEPRKFKLNWSLSFIIKSWKFIGAFSEFGWIRIGGLFIWVGNRNSQWGLSDAKILWNGLGHGNTCFVWTLTLCLLGCRQSSMCQRQKGSSNTTDICIELYVEIKDIFTLWHLDTVTSCLNVCLTDQGAIEREYIRALAPFRITSTSLSRN